MKVIKIGKVGFPTSREVTCYYCDSVLEVWSNELIRLSDSVIHPNQFVRRKGVICPICGAEIPVSFDGSYL